MRPKRLPKDRGLDLHELWQRIDKQPPGAISDTAKRDPRSVETRRTDKSSADRH